MNRESGLDKKICLAAFAAAGTTALLMRSAYERRTLTVPVYTVRTEKKLHAARTFVFLSDLHNASFGAGNSALLAAVDAAAPDAVLIGGDMMNAVPGADLLPVLDLCEHLTEKYPVYYGNGNHETRLAGFPGTDGTLYETFAQALADMGAVLLANTSAVFDGDIRISGLNLSGKYYRRFVREEMSTAFIRESIGPADEARFQILLAHSPLYFDAYAAWGADLALAGHFHGGTIRLPGGVGLMTPQFQFFSREVVGLKKQGSSRMIISAGLGTHSVNIRLNDKPQLVVARIEQA